LNRVAGIAAYHRLVQRPAGFVSGWLWAVGQWSFDHARVVVLVLIHGGFGNFEDADEREQDAFSATFSNQP
jgi:hypothetical protein